MIWPGGEGQPAAVEADRRSSVYGASPLTPTTDQDSLQVIDKRDIREAAGTPLLDVSPPAAASSGDVALRRRISHWRAPNSASRSSAHRPCTCCVKKTPPASARARSRHVDGRMAVEHASNASSTKAAAQPRWQGRRLWPPSAASQQADQHVGRVFLGGDHQPQPVLAHLQQPFAAASSYVQHLPAQQPRSAGYVRPGRLLDHASARCEKSTGKGRPFFGAPGGDRLGGEFMARPRPADAPHEPERRPLGVDSGQGAWAGEYARFYPSFPAE